MRKYILYAFGEILLVVIGILIALQVNNWNENKKDLAREKAIITELHNEFLFNKEQLDFVVGKHKQSIEGCEKIIDLMPIDIELTNMDSLRAFLGGVLKSSTYNPSNGTINALISTSSFEIISDKTLRELLISWKDVIEDYLEDERQAQAFLDEYLNPYTFRYFDYNFDWNNPKNQLAMLESIEFENLIKKRRSSLRRFVEISDNEYDVVRNYIDQILELTSER